MKQLLAERLLAKVMQWSDEEVKTELRPLLLLAEVKYDEYHQFSPGMRFVERLARWLNQLQPADRSMAFRVVRDHLIFISSSEMNSLIGMAYPEYILPLQRQMAAQRAGIEAHRICKIEASEAFRTCVAKTLYIGLSDGSQIGMLRRMNPGVIDHESTLLTHSLENKKATEISEKLVATLAARGIPEHDPRFEIVALVDDFTASGTSFLRQEDTDFDGKLARVIRDMKEGDTLGKLVDLQSLTILVLFYISTNYALERIKSTLNTFCEAEELSITTHVTAVHIIDDTAINVCGRDADVDALFKNRFDLFSEEVLDRHYQKGDCTNPHRGFNGGDLPLVLFHNAPNNGLPAIWHESEKNTALFPRTTRHGRK
jgi:hypothetical protein